MERRTTVSDAPQAIDVRVVSISDIEPNPWNPNKMDAFTYTKALDSIKRYGPIDPITVRPHPSVKGRWQIIDGEHRWKAARDLGLKTFPIVDLGPIDDQTAMKLTVVLNELRGQYDPRAMSDLLSTLLESDSIDALVSDLPFTESSLAGLLNLDIQWPTPETAPREKKEKVEKDRWVERTFRLPMSVNAILQSALDKAKDGEDVTDVTALEWICADYLGGT